MALLLQWQNNGDEHMIEAGIFKTISTPEEQAAHDSITAKLNRPPMKLYRMEYYLYNPKTDIFELHQATVNAKQLAECVIDNAFNKNFKFREVKEL